MSNDGLNIDATVLGNEEVKKRFLDLGSSVRLHIRSALLNAGKMIQAAESSLAPRKSGDLADTIRVKVVETNTSSTLSVRPSKFYAQFMEFGVVNHGTKNNSRGSIGSLRNKGNRRALVERVRELRSRGQYRIQPTHFIGRAWEATEAKANAEIAKAVSEAVNEAKT